MFTLAVFLKTHFEWNIRELVFEHREQCIKVIRRILHYCTLCLLHISTSSSFCSLDYVTDYIILRDSISESSGILS